MPPAISIRNLTKFYGDLKALDNLSLEVKEGEFFGFLGPNGAGKTTTINILTGLTNYNKGGVKVFGLDVTGDYRDARKLIGLVPQEFNFDLFLTIDETMRYYAGYFGITGHEARKRIDEILELLGLLDKKRAEVRKLSGGLKRRLLIARGLVHRPKLLIMDEPTAGVDVELRREIWHMMREMNREGTTILLTTHYIEEAERMASRVGIINKGRIIAIDDKPRLIEKLHKINLDLIFDKPIARMPRILEKYKPLLLDDFRIRMVCPDRKMQERILADVKRAGLGIKSFETTRSSLEDIFLELTGVGSRSDLHQLNKVSR